jgi:predicted transcriptional regulator
MVPESIDAELRRLAAVGDRPLSRVIRRALEDYVARETSTEAAA